MKEGRQCTYKRTIKARSPSRCCSGKVIIITYSQCVSVALVTQHAKRMSNMLSTVPRIALQHFST